MHQDRAAEIQESSSMNARLALVAQANGIASSDDLEAYLITEKVPAFLDLGAAYARIHPDSFGSFTFGNIDNDRDGMDFDFSYQDVYVRVAQENGLRLLPSLGPFKSQSPEEWVSAASYIPMDASAYRAYVRAAVERYDGDGVDDMPGLTAPVKYWQLDNEADLHYKVRGFGSFESPGEYDAVLKMTYEEMKTADPQAQLMINVAGLGQGVDSAPYLQGLIDLGSTNYFDILSYHVYPNSYDFAAVRGLLATMRDMVGIKPIWITETAITSQDVAGFQGSGSERAQAAWLLKDYLYHRANGVQKAFWLSLTDMSPVVQSFAKYSGLKTFGAGQKKLSYYAYKKMAEKLEGSGWSDIEIVVEQAGGIHAYKFTRNGRPVWAAWNDGGQDAVLAIAGVATTCALVTEAVPFVDAGSGVSDYSNAFSMRTAGVLDGSVSVSVSSLAPVYVEPFAPCTLKTEKIHAFSFPNPGDCTTHAGLTADTAAGGASLPAFQGVMIRYTLPDSGAGKFEETRINIYNVTGGLVRTINQGYLEGNRTYYTPWNCGNDGGKTVGSAVYLAEIVWGSQRQFIKIAIIKGSGL
ncbi:MAG: hypothetical protein HY924_07650 [Elusimicrobia bacterium]|nr:hypothetical protein [Elusimicrobiota bacterium]